MCKYCTNDFEKRENYFIDKSNNIDYGNLGIGLVRYEINPGNFIMFEMADLIRENEDGKKPVRFGVAVNPSFKYCPFCGRKLEYECT